MSYTDWNHRRHYHLDDILITAGMHNDMLYLQPSDTFLKTRVAQDVDDEDEDEDKRADGDDRKQVQVYMPRVKWKPYIATGDYDNDVHNYIYTSLISKQMMVGREGINWIFDLIPQNCQFISLVSLFNRPIYARKFLFDAV